MTPEEATEPRTDSTGHADGTTNDGVRGEKTDTEAEREPVAVTQGPPRETQVLTVGAALVGAGLTTSFTIASIPFGVAGVAVVALSVLTAYSVRWLSIGVSMIFVGTILAGALGALSVEVALFGVAATIVSWDAGQHGIVLGRQVGRESPTRRNLAVHVAATVVTVTLVASISYVVWGIAGGGRPAPAVAVVTLGVVLLAWSFRR